MSRSEDERGKYVFGRPKKNTTIKYYNETGFKGLYNYKGVKGTVTALVEILVKFWAEEHPTLIGIIGKDITLEGDKLGGLIIADGIHPFNGEFQENTVFFGTWDLSRNKPVTTLSKDNETYILDTTV